MEHFYDDIDEKELKQSRGKFFGILLLILVLLLSLTGYGVYWLFFDMNRLPTGDLIVKSTSPSGDYTINAYVTSNGATTDFAVRAELVFNKSNNKKKNIYWNYREENAEIIWVDDKTVKINGHLLNLPSERFDYRRE